MKWVLGLVGVLAGLVAGTQSAAACSWERNGAVVPNDTHTTVPTNTRIWALRGVGCYGDFALHDAADNPVEVELSEIGHSLHVMTPVQPLVIGEQYEVQGCSGLSVLPRFTVTAEEDLVPPTAPLVGDVEKTGDDCGPGVAYKILNPGVVTVANLHGSATLDSELLSGDVHSVFIGTQGSDYLGAHDSDTPNLSLGAFDLAGNFSGWGPSTNMHEQLSCNASAALPRSAVPSSGRWTWLCAAAALVMLRRRRG